MSGLKVSLFGKLNIACGKKTYTVRARKVQELFIYLLLFRNRPQPRELLSEVLWADQSADISRRNLRQTLWHLQAFFRELRSSSRLELSIEQDWIQISLPAGFWLDTADFERVFDRVNHKRARELSREDFEAMHNAVALYQGDLLEGWYQDWCVFERERFQMMYLMLLDKLVQYCEIHQKYDAGLAYGWQILRQDQAYERAHRQIMRLHAMSGDRTQALHQYRRCVDALREQLGVEPSEGTKQLYEQIRSDAFMLPRYALQGAAPEASRPSPDSNEVLHRLEQFALSLRKIESQVQQEIAALEVLLAGQGDLAARKLPRAS